ncbi:MAG: hypothetical protein BWZ10_03315 [candidate division BRC1 bacterium ADurb.BinA364]|nr:MAG: hypothetical protein BWZ10_03315 [candidate division BRC1 bacterium ADurb.BinA364]
MPATPVEAVSAAARARSRAKPAPVARPYAIQARLHSAATAKQCQRRKDPAQASARPSPDSDTRAHNRSAAR